MNTRSRKPTATRSASHPASTSPGDTPEAPSHNIWLAGLGAMARTQAEGSKAFDSLVQQGLDWQNQARDRLAQVTAEVSQQAEALAARSAAPAVGRWNALEGIFEQRVARALNALGVADQAAIAALQARVSALEQALAASQAAVAPSATPSPAKRRTRRTGADE